MVNAIGKGEMRSAVGETGDRVKGRAIVFAAIEGGKERSGFSLREVSPTIRL